MMRVFLLTAIIVLSFGKLATAQETKPAKTDSADYFSDYSEYSWLWDDPKAKAKAEKKRLKEEKKRQKQLAKEQKDAKASKATTPPDTSQSTTKATEVPTSAPPASETIAEETIIPADTIPEPTLPTQPADTLKVPEVPLDSAEVTEEVTQETVEEVAEDTEEEVKKQKDRKDDDKDIQDFRAGLAAVQTASTLRGGFSYTNIGGQNFVGLTLSPELNLGKVGLGLNIPILYGLDDQSLRTDIFEDGIGVGRLITYVRFGVQKKDPVYVRVGELNNTMIGFGGLVNNYSNSISYEKRKVIRFIELFKDLTRIY